MQCYSTAQLGTDQLVGPLVVLSLILCLVVWLIINQWRSRRQRAKEWQREYEKWCAKRKRQEEGRVAFRRRLIQKAWDYRRWSRSSNLNRFHRRACLDNYQLAREEIQCEKSGSRWPR